MVRRLPREAIADDAIGTAQIEDGGVTGADIAITSQADGDLLARSAGAWSRLPLGSALQHLRVNAGATALEYADPSAGVMTLESVTDFDAAADNEAWFTDLDQAKRHLFVFDQLTVASSDWLKARTSPDTGASPTENSDTDYDLVAVYVADSAATANVVANDGLNAINIPAGGVHPDATEAAFGKIEFSGLASGAYLRAIARWDWILATGHLRGSWEAYGREDTDAVNAIRFYTSAGNDMTGGKILHYTIEVA